MCKLFDDWSASIKEYCDKNDFDYEKAKSMSQCWGRDILALQYYDPEKGKNGLLDETPMPLVLLIEKTPDGLIFKQTEHTKKYLKKAS